MGYSDMTQHAFNKEAKVIDFRANTAAAHSRADSTALMAEIDLETAVTYLEKLTIVETIDLGVVVIHRGHHPTQGWIYLGMTSAGRCGISKAPEVRSDSVRSGS